MATTRPDLLPCLGYGADRGTPQRSICQVESGHISLEAQSLLKRLRWPVMTWMKFCSVVDFEK
jgi:hypothetical protein